MVDGDCDIEAKTTFSQRITPDKQKALDYIRKQKYALDHVFHNSIQHHERVQHGFTLQRLI
jgi:hypothetical protein